MSQLGSITAEKEKQMDLERQRFQEVKAKMLAQQKYKRAARTAGHIVLNIVVALIVLLPLLYAVSIAFMPSGELFTLDIQLPDSQRMELAGFLSGTDRALSHICNGNLSVQTVLSYISDFAV